MSALKVTRPGISRVEVLVVGVILFLLAMFAFVGFLKVGDANARARCIHHLQILGQASASYATGAKGETLPTEAGGQSFYVALLPHVGQAKQVPTWSTDPRTVKEFLCPRRRDPTVGPKDDYGYGTTSALGISILDAPGGLTLKQIADGDGTQYTLLLAHKGMCPKFYNGTGPADTGWATLDHARDPTSNAKDADDLDMAKLIGGPHTNANYAVFADGHTAGIPYNAGEEKLDDVSLMSLLWAYNDGKDVPEKK